MGVLYQLSYNGERGTKQILAFVLFPSEAIATELQWQTYLYHISHTLFNSAKSSSVSSRLVSTFMPVR